MHDFKNEFGHLMLGDCLVRLKEIPDQSVDLVLADPPYAMTGCSWDSMIDLDLMWGELKRIVKPQGAIVMTASQPFTSKLVVSNIEMFKYSMVWHKSRASNFVHANFQPLKDHEDILIWSFGGAAQGSKSPMTYNPQLTDGVPYNKGVGHGTNRHLSGGLTKQKTQALVNKTGKRKPRSVVYFSSDSDGKFRGLHPTQKPVLLIEYLVKTFSNPGNVVVDFTFGSCSTGVACLNTGRMFIGVEKDPEIFNIGKDRFVNASKEKRGSILD